MERNVVVMKMPTAEARSARDLVGTVLADLPHTHGVDDRELRYSIEPNFVIGANSPFSPGSKGRALAESLASEGYSLVRIAVPDSIVEPMIQNLSGRGIDAISFEVGSEMNPAALNHRAVEAAAAVNWIPASRVAAR